MKTYGGVGVWSYIFFTSALVWGQWSYSRAGRFIVGDRAPGTHWMGSWVDPRTGQDDGEKRKFLVLPGLELDYSVVQPVTSRYTDWTIPDPIADVFISV
jgi:hypothetical protein